MLTYCTNIHPGESWDDVQRGIFENVPRIRAAVPGRFPLSVWISGRAAREIEAGGSAAFQDWLRANDCEVRSINGFPFGAFHGVRVKERVYLPDWRDPERVAYTASLGRILAGWLAGDAPGVISTVPLGFGGEGDWSAARRNFVAALEALDGIAQQTGKQLVLAIEAEPACMLETTPQVVRFFEELALPARLLRHAGACFDCCHHAVQFEDAGQSLRALAAAGVPLAQAQISAALRVRGGELSSLARFDEPVYLHQAVGRRTDGSLLRYADLPQALAANVDGRDVDEWRVHFHVPIFAERLGDCRTTQPELLQALAALEPEVPLVVETYSFGVLPKELQAASVAESVSRELAWARDHRSAAR